MIAKERIILMVFILLIFNVTLFICHGQESIKWSKDGNKYYTLENNEIYEISLTENNKKKIIGSEQFGKTFEYSNIEYFTFSDDGFKVLLFTNTKKVWRINTRGDYWVYDLQKGILNKIGKTLKPSSLMFAKFSPDGRNVAYVSENNIYLEDLSTSEIRALTFDGSVTLINGTFDWVYEEEFSCRDGFRWSPDSKSIAFWQLDAGKIGKYLMLNTTDSVYSKVIPVEYPKTGEKPSVCKTGIIDVESGEIKWINIPGESDQNYLIRMEFVPNSNKLLIQQLNRLQNESRLYTTDVINTDKVELLYKESDEAWIDYFSGDFASDYSYEIDYKNDFIWINKEQSILWISEKDGWKHVYEVSLNNKSERLITKDDYDVIDVRYAGDDYIYYIASPENATQRYLYRISFNGEEAQLLDNSGLKGFHSYSISPNGKFAFHSFTSSNIKPSSEIISLPDHKPLDENTSINSKLKDLREEKRVEFFKVKTDEGIEMDGWMVKPKNFRPEKKYPVLFYVYTEPWETTVLDYYGKANNKLYQGDLSDDGYIYISIDNRGTPAPKGSEWRKAIYKKIGQVNIRDQAMAAKEILKWKFVDPERIAVWGWSGGGSATLNLLFQYPEIYKTGIAIAPVSNLLTYDNVYEERYMGLPRENMTDYIKGSPVTYANNLQGNLLYIHGTGDDNVHYQNAEMLVNELIKYNKQFSFMAYPNRTHSISEGAGTRRHLSTLYTEFLKTHCPPGPR